MISNMADDLAIPEVCDLERRVKLDCPTVD
jgi:hypothetical protein